MIDRSFWCGKRVFLTGHTGFKGSWLSLLLSELGAEVTGYALEPPTEPSLYRLCRIDQLVNSVISDIRDVESLHNAFQTARPAVVIHMAAQPLVIDSYNIPSETFAVNVMGAVNILETVRTCPGAKAVVNVTTDKCYENREWIWGYRENDPLGGYDPYSGSKACSELVTATYRNSFFNPGSYASHGLAIASARAGNVIGGGDWACNRLIPDCVRALLKGEVITIRNPRALRPWQHVLEPLSGYIMLAQKLYESGSEYGSAWNFGPNDDACSVEWIVQNICSKWVGASYSIDDHGQPHEAHCLKLDCSKARAQLGWKPRWNLEQTIDKIIEWTFAYREKRDVREICLAQIHEYFK
jgi:CDP-glucose 4,6-dehydratase